MPFMLKIYFCRTIKLFYLLSVIDVAHVGKHCLFSYIFSKFRETHFYVRDFNLLNRLILHTLDARYRCNVIVCSCVLLSLIQIFEEEHSILYLDQGGVLVAMKHTSLPIRHLW